MAFVLTGTVLQGVSCATSTPMPLVRTISSASSTATLTEAKLRIDTTRRVMSGYMTLDASMIKPYTKLRLNRESVRVGYLCSIQALPGSSVFLLPCAVATPIERVGAVDVRDALIVLAQHLVHWRVGCCACVRTRAVNESRWCVTSGVHRSQDTFQRKVGVTFVYCRRIRHGMHGLNAARARNPPQVLWYFARSSQHFH